MDEEKQEQTAGKQEETPQQPARKKESAQERREKSRRTFLFGAAGAYLIYLAVQIVRDLFGNGSVEWSVSTIIGLIAAVVFVGFGVLFLVKIALWFKEDLAAKKEEEEKGEE